MSTVIKDSRGSLTNCLVVITSVPEMAARMITVGARGVVVLDEQREDELVIVEMLAEPKWRIWLSPQNFELAPLESPS